MCYRKKMGMGNRLLWLINDVPRGLPVHFASSRLTYVFSILYLF